MIFLVVWYIFWGIVCDFSVGVVIIVIFILGESKIFLLELLYMFMEELFFKD